jgi:hypothetical protein
MYIYTYTHIILQPFILAFMMGLHLRLGTESPVLLLDPSVARLIAEIVITEKWCASLLRDMLWLSCVCMHGTCICIYGHVCKLFSVHVTILS